MSSVSTSPWRRPNFILHTALSPLLANDQLHDALVHTVAQPVQAHGPSNHSDRVVDYIFTADRFQSLSGGTFTTVNTLPVWTMANAADTQLVANLEVPQTYLFATGQIVISHFLVVRPAGVVGAGNARLGVTAAQYRNGTPISSLSVGTFAVAIGAEDAVPTLLEVSPPSVSLGGGTAIPRILHVLVRREANIAQDSFEDALHFAGVIVEFTVDQ